MNSKVTSTRTNRRPTFENAVDRFAKENRNPNAHAFLQNLHSHVSPFVMTTKAKSSLKTPQNNQQFFPQRKQSRVLQEARLENQLTRPKPQYTSIGDVLQSNHLSDLRTGNKEASRVLKFYVNPNFLRRNETTCERESVVHATSYTRRRDRSANSKLDSKRKSQSRVHSKSNINIFQPVINLSQSISIGCMHPKQNCQSYATTRNTHKNQNSGANNSICSIKQRINPQIQILSMKNANQSNLLPSTYFSQPTAFDEENSGLKKKVSQKNIRKSSLAPKMPESRRSVPCDYAQRPNYCTKYFKSIINYMVHKESVQLKIKERFTEFQDEVTERMKMILYDWLTCIAEKFKLRERTLLLTLEFIELYMNAHYVSKDDFQLIGVACLFVASKYEEIYPPKIDDFCKTTDNYYSKSRIFEVEGKLLKLLDFDVTRLITYDFYQIISIAAQFDEKALNYGFFLMNICSLDSSFFQGAKSLMAFGLCYLLHKIFKLPPFFKKCEISGEKLLRMNICQGKFEEVKQSEGKWTSASPADTFDLLFREEEIRQCARNILSMATSVAEPDCKNIFQKFKDSRFLGVARLSIIQRQNNMFVN
jgi:hypothetical protein